MFAKAQEINFAEGDNIARIQVLKTGKFDHPIYGEMKITDETLTKMKKNFDDAVRRVDLPVNYSHNSGGEAAGWFKDVIIEDGALYAEVEWTGDGEKKVKEKQFRYVSAEFNFDYQDSETGEKFGPTLLGAALTNIPFLKGMDAILSEYESLSDEAKKALKERIFTDEKKEKEMNFEDLKKAVADLSEDQKNEIAKMMGFPKAKKELSEDADENKKLQEENKKLKEKITLSEKEREFDVLLSEGKAVPAQKEAYITGDMKAFMDKAVEINLDEKGTSQNKNLDDKAGKSDDEMTSDKAQNKIMELAEGLVKNKNINLSEAISQVRFENPDLVKAIA